MEFREIVAPSLKELFVQQLEGMILSGELRPGDREQQTTEEREMRDINGSKPTNFPLDGEKLPFKIPCPDRPPRENILKLGSMITNRIGLKATVDDPEYWGLDGRARTGAGCTASRAWGSCRPGFPNCTR